MTAIVVIGCGKPITKVSTKETSESTLTEEEPVPTQTEIETSEEEVIETPEEETIEEITEEITEVTEETPEEKISEERIVLAESQIPNISFNLKDKEELERVLLEFGFWEKAGLFGFGEYRTVKPKKLIIYLTDQEQPWFPYIAGEKVLYSKGSSFDGENYNLFLYIEPSIIKELEEVMLSHAADWHFFEYLYYLAHPEGEEFEEDLTLEITKAYKLFTKYQEKEESTFFEIKKH